MIFLLLRYFKNYFIVSLCFLLLGQSVSQSVFAQTTPNPYQELQNLDQKIRQNQNKVQETTQEKSKKKHHKKRKKATAASQKAPVVKEIAPRRRVGLIKKMGLAMLFLLAVAGGAKADVTTFFRHQETGTNVRYFGGCGVGEDLAPLFKQGINDSCGLVTDLSRAPTFSSIAPIWSEKTDKCDLKLDALIANGQSVNDRFESCAKTTVSSIYKIEKDKKDARDKESMLKFVKIFFPTFFGTPILATICGCGISWLRNRFRRPDPVPVVGGGGVAGAGNGAVYIDVGPEADPEIRKKALLEEGLAEAEQEQPCGIQEKQVEVVIDKMIEPLDPQNIEKVALEAFLENDLQVGPKKIQLSEAQQVVKEIVTGIIEKVKARGRDSGDSLASQEEIVKEVVQELISKVESERE